MRRITLLSAFIVGFMAVAEAQTSDYETMKEKLSDVSIPLVNIVVEIDKVNKPDYTPATVEIADPLKRTDGKLTAEFNCKVKYRGASSLSYDKKSFAVKLLNEKGKSMDAAVLGIREDDAWILDAMAIDRLRMRNRVNFDVWNDMSRTPYDTDTGRRNGTDGYFVELFINGSYHGLYCLTDKVNRKLLGVKKVKEHDDKSVDIKGVMYKCAAWGQASKFRGYEESSMDKASWNNWELDYPDDYPCTEAYMPLKNFIDFCSSSTDAEFADGLDDNLYLQNFMEYHVFLLAEGLLDNSMKNCYMSIVDTGKGKRMMVTPWDLDCSLGGYWEGSYYNVLATNDTPLDVMLYERLWNNDVDDYKNKVADCWRALCQTGVLSKEAFDRRVDSYVDELVASGAWQREYGKWNGNPVPLKADLREEARYVKDWYSRNADHIENDILGSLGTSGISAVSAAGTHGGNEDVVYNVMGQRVDNSYRGIVIVNGRKLLRR